MMPLNLAYKSMYTLYTELYNFPSFLVTRETERFVKNLNGIFKKSEIAK